jgi:hypothetical protein
VKRHLVFKNEAQIFNVTNQGIIVTQKYWDKCWRIT